LKYSTNVPGSSPLKAIFEIQHKRARVVTTELARRMGVTSASVTNMIQRLAEMELVDYEPYRGATLNPAGRRIALRVIRHHRLVESFLAETLGVPWDQVHAEAERLEHLLSEEMEARIDALLGQPTVDPHGAPIPTRDGRIAPSANLRLADLQPGQKAVVAEVSDRDPALLRYLGGLGLYPGVGVNVVASAPFNGPLTIQVGETETALGRRVAADVLVTRVTNTSEQW
jgi:DtxR family Mn-dependent transcriptional regulator